MVRLDRDGWTAGKGDALNNVGIERALGQVICASEFFRLIIKNINEQSANNLALLLGIIDAFQSANEAVSGFHVDKRNIIVAAEHLHDLRSLILTHQPMIDKDTCELVTNGLVYEHSCNR